MKIQFINSEDLQFAEYNPRELPKGAIERLKKSLSGDNGRKFFEKRPCLVNKRDGRLVVYGGNQRLRAARELGWKEIPCDVDEISLEEERERNIKDNLVIGDWDSDILANNFDIHELDDWGVDLKELDISLEPEPEQDEVPEPPKEARAKRGEVYQLGRHRLMCGDSTQITDVERLMDGKKADMVFTDPPYGISWKTDYTSLAKGRARHSRNAFSKIEGDDSKFDVGLVFSLADILFLFGANYYSDQLPVGGWVVWDKAHETGNYLFSQAEGAWTNKINAVRIFRHKWQGHDRQSERGEKTAHPTQKPIILISEILNDLFKNELSVIDPFLGSGSTLIACEQTNRICYGMEIDPKYCDVIIERYCNYTGANKEDIYNSVQVVQERV